MNGGKIEKRVAEGVEEKMIANRWTRENRRYCWDHEMIAFQNII